MNNNCLIIVVIVVVILAIVGGCMTRRMKGNGVETELFEQSKNGDTYLNSIIDDNKNILRFIKTQRIKNLVVWGLRNSGHSHKYIHSAIFDMFKYIKKTYKLNVNVSWVDDDNGNEPLTDPSLIFSSPHYDTDRYIPVSKNNYYILHYYYDNYITKEPVTKYDELIDLNRAVLYKELRYKTDSNIKDIVQIKPYFYYDKHNNAVIMPWATNINPTQVIHNIENLSMDKSNKRVVFIGTIWYLNKDNIKKLKDACKKYKLKYKHYKGISDKQNQELVKNAYAAPAIQGEEHLGDYIPCRIFKNISYGAYPITNNNIVYDLFDKKILYDDNIDTLTRKMADLKYTKDMLVDLMMNVASNHTYLQRISLLVSYLSA